MTRKEFLQRTSILSMGAVLFPSILQSCNNSNLPRQTLNVNFKGSVLVIGAGSAGMTAAYALQQNGVDFQVLEASNRFGGRVKRIEDFADFPIDLGGEWIHTDPSVMDTIINDPKVNSEVETIVYNPTVESLKNGKLKKNWLGTTFYSEHKFKNTTWYGFFEKYIVPSISDNIIYNSPVSEIDYSGKKVKVTTKNGEQYEADRLILTVPINIIKGNYIKFFPAIPEEKMEIFNELEMPDGIKVFMEFSERFYPDVLVEGSVISKELLDSDGGDRTYYDAAFKKGSQKNILGLFSQGKPASKYANAASDEDTIKIVLDELDNFFNGKATKYYVKHTIQNWTKEPYIGGSYTQYTRSKWQRTLREPIENKIFFAGETYADEWATVHGAALSAYRAVERLVS